MKLRQLFIGFLLTISLFSCSANRKTKKNEFTLVREDFKKHFEKCGVDGSIALYDNTKNQWMVSDTTGIHKETLPASTFKIINLLIALETKTIQDENEVVKWVGTTDTIKYGYRPEIYHDMTVKEAFEVSAGWVFIELAKKIGKDNYKKYLSACNYGNLNLSQIETDFWNFGDFAISPINQVEFIKKLYNYNLPFSKRNIEIVKKVMITEQNEKYTIRAKTGWTRANSINTGWWVGYLEIQKNVYFFATKLIQDRKYNRDDFGTCRKEITKKVFKDLNIME
jgi:beta-lactamase class D